METDYLTRKDAVDFIKDCKKRQFRIYGVERFLLSDGRFVPDLDGIADFSEVDVISTSSSVDAARKFIDMLDVAIEERFKLVY